MFSFCCKLAVGWFKKKSSPPVEYANYQGLSSDPLAGSSMTTPVEYFNAGGANSGGLGITTADVVDTALDFVPIAGGIKDIYNVQSNGGVTIDNSWQATKHYLFGDGSPANIGPKTTTSLLNSPEFLKAHKGIITGQSNTNGTFSVDMTKRVFHIGRTNVSYNVGPNSVTYKLYDGDGFWDPDFIDEKYLGPYSPYFRPDGPGPNLERLGGTPYYYIPTVITFPY